MFNINEFRAKFESYGGPAKLNLFVVELFSSNSNWMSDNDLRFFCKAVSIPAFNLELANYRPYGTGEQISLPVAMNHGNLNAIFMLDNSHRVLSFFHEWMQSIYNYDTSKGLLGANYRDASQLPFEFGYKKEYALNMRIKVFSSNNPENYYEYLFRDVFPTELGGLELSWDTNDQYAILPVNFSYGSSLVSGARAGEIQNPLSRSFGLLDYIISVANIVQTVQSVRKPIDVQDAINQYTSVRNTFSQLFTL